MIKKYFITGTDTNVGKTIISCALIKYFVKKGYKTIGYKPIASGSYVTNLGSRNDDVIKLLFSSNVNLKYNQINIYSLINSTSPHIASMDEKIKINIKKISKNLKKLESLGDYIFIEGAGGWFTPLSNNYFFSDWVIYEKISVILVVGLKLGCLNHALLTIESIKNSNINITGWIANHLYPITHRSKEYIISLNKMLKIPLLGEFPWIKKLEKTDTSKYIKFDF
ncbi:dethiobiotin synthase [Sodalis-like secondary symbiont of Drepanosiphum platanoidis]|uniref:dethiobiotin synthase n=1 Tax=Sodalis-like secondary symbiont of Drepanosiphum platanoidis TaxID=2994493 RepID=UPI003463870E